MEPNPLVSDPAPAQRGPAVPLDPADLWDEALQEHSGPHPEDEDPFGYGGGMDDLDVADPDGSATPPPRAVRPAGTSVQAPAAPSCPHRPLSGSGVPRGDPRFDSDEEDPFGWGGGMDDLDRPTAQGTHTGGTTASGAAQAPEVVAPPCCGPPASVTGPQEAGRHRLLDPAPSAVGGGQLAHTGASGVRSEPAPAAPSVPSHRTLSAPRATAVKSEPASTACPCPKVETGAGATAAQRSDRRAALAAHLSRRPAPTLARREASLQRSMLALQRQCADLSRTMAEVNARQGPLVQRLHAAQEALTSLSSSPATVGSSAVQALQATLSQALQAHRAMQPSP